MPAAVRSYVTTGLALMGTGLVTAGQVTPPLQAAETRIVQAAVNLAAAVGNGQPCSGYNTEGCDIWAKPTYTPVALDPSGSLANIPANLFNAVLSAPGAFLDGLNELSYALEVTGNWWVYSPTNVLGFDPADPPKITALADLLIPFKPLSNAIGDQLAWWARANLPMNASCTGTVGPACSDVGPILSSMFLAPIWTLASGYQFPELYNPVSDAEGALGEEIPGSQGQLAPWSGDYVKLNTSDWFTSVLNYLQADPASNAPAPITLSQVGATLERFAKALVIAFNPFVPKSYLLKGWPYTALTPLFLPFVPLLCKECDPNNPGGPAVVPAQSAAAQTPEAVLVSAPQTEPADVPAAVEVSGPPAAGTGQGERDHAAEAVSAGADPAVAGTDAAVTPAADAAPAVADAEVPDTANDAGAQADVPEDLAATQDLAQDLAQDAAKDAASTTVTAPPRQPLRTPRSGRSISVLEVLPGDAQAKAGSAGAAASNASRGSVNAADGN